MAEPKTIATFRAECSDCDYWVMLPRLSREPGGPAIEVVVEHVGEGDDAGHEVRAKVE